MTTLTSGVTSFPYITWHFWAVKALKVGLFMRVNYSNSYSSNFSRMAIKLCRNSFWNKLLQPLAHPCCFCQHLLMKRGQSCHFLPSFLLQGLQEGSKIMTVPLLFNCIRIQIQPLPSCW